MISCPDFVLRHIMPSGRMARPHSGNIDILVASQDIDALYFISARLAFLQQQQVSLIG